MKKKKKKDYDYFKGFLDGASGKEPACQCRRHETQV